IRFSVEVSGALPSRVLLLTLSRTFLDASGSVSPPRPHYHMRLQISFPSLSVAGNRARNEEKGGELMGVDTLWVDGKVDRDMRVTTDRSYITVNSKARRAEIQRALMLQCTSDAQVMTIGRNGARSAWNCQWFNIAMVDEAMKAASSVKMTKTPEAIT
ncbi:unnamed protein product, partial [Brassica oleracea]